MFVDVPSDQVLPEMEKSIRKMMEDLMLNEKKKVVIERIEWTAEGLRLWIQN